MRFAFLTLYALLTVAPLQAENAESVVASLIAETWAPRRVRVEWQFKGKTPEAISRYDGWTLADFRPSRMAGSMIVVLQHRDSEDKIKKVAVSGVARVFGESLSPIRRIAAGEAIDSVQLAMAEHEWTHLNADPVNWESIKHSMIAARALVPDRPITLADLKPAPTVRREQRVDLQYVEGAIRIRLSGRALEDGAVGETIAVAVDMGKTRRFEGTVIADGTVQIVR